MIKDIDSPSIRQAGRLFWPWALTLAPPLADQPASWGAADFSNARVRRAANGQGAGESRFAVVALMKLNPVLLEEDRHRRMNVLVGAADFESALTQRRRHGAHGRAAVPDEMKFLERGFHKRLFYLVA